METSLEFSFLSLLNGHGKVLTWERLLIGGMLLLLPVPCTDIPENTCPHVNITSAQQVVIMADTAGGVVGLYRLAVVCQPGYVFTTHDSGMPARCAAFELAEERFWKYLPSCERESLRVCQSWSQF